MKHNIKTTMTLRYGFAIMMALMVASCKEKVEENKATGMFEGTETTVSSEQSGRLVSFNVEEGDNIEAGQEVGLVDTIPFQLKIQQATATREVYAAQQPDVEAQIAATEEQLAKARLEERRYSELVADGAAPRKQLDDARSQVKVLEKQLVAQKSTLGTQTRTLNQQQKTTETQKAELRDNIRKCHIKTAMSGTVLEKYVEQGEFVTAGKPLFKMADMQHLYLRAYVTSAQLADIKLGQKVKVRTDYGDKKGKEYTGTITWISNKSEFTPKTILTDDERADLVYAIKVAVVNDGGIKLGMYGNVVFGNK